MSLLCTCTSLRNAVRKAMPCKMRATRISRSYMLLLSLLSVLPSAQSDDQWRWRASRTTSFDFGSCPNPGITWDYDLDGSGQFGFAPTDQNEFPHGFSSDISTLEIYICNRLESVCNASPPAVRECHIAFELYSGFAGQNAADSWNEALGLYGSMPSQVQTDYGTTTTAVATVLVSGTSVPFSTLFSPVSTVYSESLSSSIFSSSAPPTYTVFSTKTISQDVHSSSTSTVVLPVSVSGNTESLSTSIIVPTGATTVTLTTSSASTDTAQAQSTSTGSGDGGGSPFSGKARVLEPFNGPAMMCLLSLALLVLYM